MDLILFLLPFVGVVGFFMGNPYLVIIGGIASLLVNLIGLFSGQQRSFIISILAIFIAFALFGNIYVWWFVVLLALTFEGAIVGIFGILLARYLSRK